MKDPATWSICDCGLSEGFHVPDCLLGKGGYRHFLEQEMVLVDTEAYDAAEGKDLSIFKSSSFNTCSNHQSFLPAYTSSAACSE